MRERVTARVLLLDPLDRVLLMKAGAPAGDRPAVWFTIGGGAHPGESVLEAAVREIREETGLEVAQVGPIVWLREGELLWEGEPTWFKESYVVARCDGGELSRQGWEAAEHALVQDIRWWTREELLASEEPIYPRGLGGLLEDIMAGRYPAAPLTLPWR
jgi:8-oxo-dGTP pyrophosphatase MutT (NUDIX family)